MNNFQARAISSTFREKYFQNHFYVKSHAFAERGVGIDPSTYFMRREFQFLHGSQERVSSSTENRDVIVYSCPASPFDWIKSLVVTFEPSLAFGWLVPSIREFKVAQAVTTTEKYINVIPTPEQYEGREAVALRYFHFDPVELDPFIFLESTPVTKSDVKQAEMKLLDIEQSAFYFTRTPVH